MAGELTAAIAHELNQPLAAILTNAETAELMVKSSTLDRDEIGEILADICRDDRRASEVIGRLRSLLKKAPFERRDINLNEIVRETMELLSKLAYARETDVSVQLDSRELRFNGDRVQIQQVIINLMVNAMDAMSDLPRGKRKISVATMRVENFTEIVVSDTGPGIPNDEREKVFQPFFTTRPKGMGMGLCIARSIVEVHGGQLWAEYKTSVGAIFHIRLPLASAAE
jgi:C4-dicarboxylate-specific signal transduction histidine kinase